MEHEYAKAPLRGDAARDYLQARFPMLEDGQVELLLQLRELYTEWNAKINLISRKDIGYLLEHHVVHSLAPLLVYPFQAGKRVLDFGTGGGFPGIPLAIARPDVEFHLVDSVGKKIRVVQDVAQQLGLKNVIAEQVRGEELKPGYSYVASRAVTDLGQLWRWTRKLMRPEPDIEPANGLLAYKGGPLGSELAPFGKRPTVWELAPLLQDSHYEEKRLILIPAVKNAG